MSTVLLFNAEQFSSLSTIEFAQQWENVSLESLWEDEQATVSEFLNLAKGESDIELNLNNVLLVKTNDDRMLDRVYGPSIFRESQDGDGLIMKVGANSFPIVIQNERLIVGFLKGRFQWQTKQRLDGSSYDLLVARLADSRADDPTVYEIGCSLAEKEPTTEVNGKLQSNPLFLSQPKLDKLLESGAGLGQFFTSAPSGNGSVFKMQQLPSNSEHEVVGVVATEPHPEYGVSYILRLAGGAAVFARGNSETFLKKNLATVQNQIAAGKTWTLKVGEIKEFTPGKFTVNNALVPRQPRLSGAAPRPIQQQRPAMQASNGNGSALATQPPKEFSETYGTRNQAIEWAVNKGVERELAQGLIEHLNSVSTQRQAEGLPFTLDDYRKSFIDSVNSHLAENPTQTVDVSATTVPTVPDEIPF